MTSKILPNQQQMEYSDNQQNRSKKDKEKIKKAIKKKKNKLNKKNNKHAKLENEEIIKKADQLIKTQTNNNQVEIEYVEEDEYIQAGQYYEEFKNVFQYFKRKQIEEQEDNNENQQQQKQEEENNNMNIIKQVGEEKEEKLSKKKRKQLKRMPVAQLKALSKRPDLVEAWDVTASDPLLLSFLKGYRNTVSVPKHWSQKRKFLQSKRGILKQAFQLPDYIEATGIARLRDPFNNDGMKMVKQKLRERMNPKLGKVDIDYEILHDAFFKYQTKPKLTIFGDIYYEGKENEVKMRTYKPGKISEQLRAALGIGELAPPPWIINMQRYGPPPAYPNLKIPGVTVPMNEAILGNIFFSRNPDTSDNPIYNNDNNNNNNDNQQCEQFLWGQFQDEDQYDQEIPDELPVHNNIEANNTDFMITSTNSHDPSGTSSVISTLHAPDVELRKNQLYTVLDQVNHNNNNSLFPQTHTYKLPEFKF